MTTHFDKSEITFSLYPDPKDSPGGQKVGGGPNGIKGVYEKFGLVAICEYERSQFRNREVVIEMLEWAVAKLVR